MHADLKHEPRRSLKYSAGEHSHGVRKCGLSHQKKKGWEKKRKNNNKKPLPLPSTLKAINGTMIKIMMIINHVTFI